MARSFRRESNSDGTHVGPRNANSRKRDRIFRLLAISALLGLALLIQWYQWRGSGDATSSDAEKSASTGRSHSAPSHADHVHPAQTEDDKQTPPDESEIPSAPRSTPVEDAEPVHTDSPAPRQEPRREPPPKRPVVIDNVTLKDADGNLVYRGSVDLQPTLDRIAAGKRLRFPNDGSTFQNREGRLPRRAAGYYHEYVHPTPKLDGPGPQRIVVGDDGEVYYTHDHYRTFKRIR